MREGGTILLVDPSVSVGYSVMAGAARESKSGCNCSSGNFIYKR